jgi:hypothetical protein
MKRALLPLALGLVLVSPIYGGEDTLTSELEGAVEVWGLNPSGLMVDDAISNYAKHDVQGEVKIGTREGRVQRIETRTAWTAPGEVSGQVREMLYVSGGTYTGWTEHYLRTKTHTLFSRNVIDGTIVQELKADGSGIIEWTVFGENNGSNEVSDDDADSVTDEDGNVVVDEPNENDRPLPVVDILEEGEFDGVSERRIEIDTHGDDRPTVTLRDEGYLRAFYERKERGQRTVTVTQKVELEGEGRGGLDFEESKPTPTPGPTPTPSPTPVTTDLDDSF